MDPLRLPEGMEPGLEAHRAYDPPPLTFSNATHVCEVVVDVETGVVRVERWIVAEDCGRVLNPAIVAGQQTARWHWASPGCCKSRWCMTRMGRT